MHNESHLYINIHTHEARPGALNLVAQMAGEGETPPAPLRSAGIHPWSLAHMSDAEVAEALAALRDDAQLAAVGEIGLDYLRGTDDRAQQRRVFAAQLDLAAVRGVPVVVHCVRALDDALRTLREHPVQAAVFHGFTGSAQQAVRITEAGYYISFGPRTFRSPKTREALRGVPRDRLFLETDDDPTTIESVYRHAADTLGIPVSVLQQAILENYNAIFG